MSLKYESLAAIPEADLVERLMSDPHWRDRVIGLHGIPSNVDYRLGVPMIGLPGNPKGDVDILLAPPNRPEFSTAVQVKRVKVACTTFKKGQPNKLRQIEKACRQANLLASIGFAQVYCFILVVVDSRTNNEGRYIYDGLTPELETLIDKTISINGFEERVGLVHFEFVQPIDSEPLGPGTFRGHMKRPAKIVGQAFEITAWVSRMMKGANA